MIIAFLYYEKEIDRQQRVCKNNLVNTVLKVKFDLLKSTLENKPFTFNPNKYKLSVGLFDAKKKKVYTSLHHDKVDFNTIMTKSPNYIHFVQKLEKPLFNVYYIVAEDMGMPIGKERLITLIMLVIFFSFIFIAFIGYLLSKLLLKPVKEKMQHIDRFIKDSAHEINTPIASLLMSVSALKKKGTADTKILNHISISSKQISDVYNSLSHLAFSDMDAEKRPTVVNFKEVLEKSVEFYAEIAKSKRITIHTNVSPLSLMIDSDDAKKLANNLLSNAVKYNKVGKDIHVTLKGNILSVKDAGIGIDEKQKKAILKRYHRATNMIGGFGIGLDIVNSICHSYDIKLHIHSKKHEGSTFSLDFQAIALST